MSIKTVFLLKNYIADERTRPNNSTDLRLNFPHIVMRRVAQEAMEKDVEEIIIDFRGFFEKLESLTTMAILKEVAIEMQRLKYSLIDDKNRGKISEIGLPEDTVFDPNKKIEKRQEATKEKTMRLKKQKEEEKQKKEEIENRTPSLF